MKKNYLKFLFIFVMYFCLINPVSAATNNTKASVYFVGTGAQDSAILVRTEQPVYENGKTILYDTGKSSNETVDKIYEKAFSFQTLDGKNVNRVAYIDYMIISHLDSDHFGNAKAILKDKRFFVNNLIIKDERFKTNIYDDIVAVAKKNGTKIYNINGKTKDEIKVSKSVKMYLYNLNDVYANKSECGTYKNPKMGKIIKFKPAQIKKANTVYKANGAFFTKTLDGKTFYAYLYEEPVQVCRSNANSIAALLEVSTSSGNKYIYLTGDLDNNGLSVSGKSYSGVQVYGTGATYFYTNGMYKGSNKEQNKLSYINSGITNIQALSEYKVAKAIKSKLGTNVNNIVIYQQSHHGQNNSQESIELLNLNRKNVYAVANTNSVPNKKNENITYEVYKSAFVTLSKAKKLYTTTKGIECSIVSTGSVSCK